MRRGRPRRAGRPAGGAPAERGRARGGRGLPDGAGGARRRRVRRGAARQGRRRRAPGRAVVRQGPGRLRGVLVDRGYLGQWRAGRVLRGQRVPRRSRGVPPRQGTCGHVGVLGPVGRERHGDRGRDRGAPAQARSDLDVPRAHGHRAGSGDPLRRADRDRGRHGLVEVHARVHHGQAEPADRRPARGAGGTGVAGGHRPGR